MSFVFDDVTSHQPVEVLLTIREQGHHECVVLGCVVECGAVLPLDWVDPLCDRCVHQVPEAFLFG